MTASTLGNRPDVFQGKAQQGVVRRVVKDCLQFYIDGQWRDPQELKKGHLVNPASEQKIATIALGGIADVDRAVQAARQAFDTWSRSSVAERQTLLRRILEVYATRVDDAGEAMCAEMGAPIKFAREVQAANGTRHTATMIEVLNQFEFETIRGTTRIRHEAAGVCGLITPWNWPINQIACKVIPAIASGCTMVLKPSELAPLSATVWTDVLHEAGLPRGVFNLVHGEGSIVGTALASHPEIDLVSFTGSTRAGVNVAQAAAPSVKRVRQELGGKSPVVVLEDADLEQAIAHTVRLLMRNSGQSCNAPSRLLVPIDRLKEVEGLTRSLADAVVVGDPTAESTQMGPVVSRHHFERVQGYIQAGIDEGARLIAGGPGRPAHLPIGFFVRPTVFSQVRNDMKIAREEIFGPVLSIISYESETDALRIANDSPYGLYAYVWSADTQRAYEVANSIRAGGITINGAAMDMHAPFGGFKQSGTGREWGEYGLLEFLELKGVVGAHLA